MDARLIKSFLQTKDKEHKIVKEIQKQLEGIKEKLKKGYLLRTTQIRKDVEAKFFDELLKLYKKNNEYTSKNIQEVTKEEAKHSSLEYCWEMTMEKFDKNLNALYQSEKSKISDSRADPHSASHPAPRELFGGPRELLEMSETRDHHETKTKLDSMERPKGMENIYQILVKGNAFRKFEKRVFDVDEKKPTSPKRGFSK